MFFKRKNSWKEYKNFSISLLIHNDANNFLKINNWFLNYIDQVDKLYADKFHLILNDIDVNYGNSKYKSIDSMLRKNHKNKLDISFFMAQTQELDEILILYDNPFSNQKDFESDSVYEARFIMMCPYEHKNILMDFVVEFVNLNEWSYGYGMSLIENQTLDGSQVKSTILSSKNIPLLANEIWDNLLLTNNFLSENGFVKDIYEFNILNMMQCEKINLLNFSKCGIGKVSLKGDKYFWILDFPDIVQVKEKLKDNPFLLSK